MKDIWEYNTSGWVDTVQTYGLTFDKARHFVAKFVRQGRADQPDKSYVNEFSPYQVFVLQKSEAQPPKSLEELQAVLHDSTIAAHRKKVYACSVLDLEKSVCGVSRQVELPKVTSSGAMSSTERGWTVVMLRVADDCQVSALAAEDECPGCMSSHTCKDVELRVCAEYTLTPTTLFHTVVVCPPRHI